jgi:acyl transferase domain-containing protein
MASKSKSRELLDRIEKLSPKRLALLATELERRLAALEEPVAQPIAVTGLACRLPGGIDTPEAFWHLLASGGDAIEVVPSSRWDAEALYDPLPGAPGKANTKWGGFVSSIDQFDPAFFGIAPREAVGMDPQQRMLLEVAWEALENAGERGDLLNGSPTGVFVGMSTNDYASLMSEQDDQAFGAYSGTGLARSVAAGRLSYFLGLRGPNLAIDTACSSSAVAIHLACQSLRQRECRLALAGGVNAILAPQLTVTLSQARMLAGDGRCKTFAQSADGFVRSEGCGMLVLKRLADAQADGDRILGIVRGSAINHDGRSSGLTAPNGPSQEEVIQAALKQALLSPDDVDYIEAHGTGTVLGDAIELGSLGACFGSRPQTQAPLILGSVKTNVGHLEAAAGVTSVIKVLLSFEHQSIPPHVHVSDGSENDALRNLPLKLPLQLAPWPVSMRPRIAGVSSFGFSGTNSHIVLEEAPAEAPRNNVDGAEIVTVSAKSPPALSALCTRHARYLRQHPQTRLTDFAFTLNTGRSHFQHRVAFLANSASEAADRLEEIAGQDLESDPAYRFIPGYEEPSIGFLFTGQGSQYAGMGRGLYESHGIFRSAIDQCDGILTGKLEHKLSSILCGDSTVPGGLIDETQITQPALFAFEYALAMLWSSWGVRPSVVAGHSLGEYVAACIAGAFPIEAALTLAYERGRLMASLPRGGAMLAIRASEAEVATILPQFPGLSLAAVNGDRSVVVSGPSAQTELLRTQLTGQGIASQPLVVSHAFHSSLMDPILEEFEQEAAKLVYDQPQVPLISNVSGQLHTPAERIDASYWRRHIRGTVRFAQGLSSLLALHPAALLEIGPDPVLLGMARPSLTHSQASSIPTLRRGKELRHSLHDALRQLYLLGAPIAWHRVYEDYPGRKLALPTYPFQRQRYWIETRRETASAAGLSIAARESSYDSLLYTTQWRVQPSSASAFEPPTPEELLGAATKAIDAMCSERDMHRAIAAYGEFFPRLDRLCTSYILEALGKLGANLQEGTHLSLVDLHEKLGVQAQHRRLIERLFAVLEEDGIVRRDGDGWVFGTIPSRNSTGERAQLTADFPWFTAELNFLGQASNLAAVLGGQMSGVEALFPNGSFELAEQIYQNAPGSRMFNRALAKVVQRSVAAYPADRVVRVLEIGAGTGSATSEILPLLKGAAVEYLYTDVSAAFFGLARNKFAEFPFVRYVSLDVEKEISTESVIAEGVDIIVAANVLHATADIAQTLNRLRSILRQDGVMLVSECTALQRLGDLTVGMTDGWWRYTDTARRQEYPLLQRRQWLELFSELGLRGTALAEDGPARMLTERQTILVAQPSAVSPHENAFTSLVIIGSTQPDIVSPALHHALQAAGIVPERLNTSAKSGMQTQVGLGHALRNRLRAETKPSSILLVLAETPVDSEVSDLTLENAGNVLELLQAALETGPSHETYKGSIWLVTKGSAGIENNVPINLPSAISHAMTRSAHLERAEMSIRWVDLPSKPAEMDWIRLGQLIREDTRETSLAVRQGKLVLPRLVALSAVASRVARPFKLKPDAAYLVTGAYGGLGFRTVQWMAELGARHIFLAGRSEPSMDIREQISQLTDRGVQIHTLLADISKRPDVENIFDKIEQTGIKLHGIVHTAGTLSDGTLALQTREKFAAVFAAKVSGSLLLDEFSRKYPLDFFVLFGSAASVLGSAGQSNHAAANGFLDALSRQRHREGLPSVTIAWGPWSDIGAAPRLKITDRAARLGIGTLSPNKGIELLEQAISSGLPEVAALPANWQAAWSQIQAHGLSAFFEELSLPANENIPSRGNQVPLNSLLETTSAENRLSVIKEYLRMRILHVLGLEAGFALRDGQPLAELGLDSLMALELKNGLQNDSSVTLTANFFFEYPTLDLAAMYLNARLAGASESLRSQAHSSDYEELAI